MAWKFELLKLMKDVKNLLYSDDHVVIINDGFRKAEEHYLVLPKENIHSIRDVTGDHIELLKKMHLVGKNHALKHGAGRKFRFGYHAEPSMDRLHLHVISDDFNSPHLKNKKHWNSYNTPFFLESTKVISDVESLGKVKLPSPSMCSQYLKTNLKCNKCNYLPRNLPDLKNHILTHQ